MRKNLIRFSSSFILILLILGVFIPVLCSSVSAAPLYNARSVVAIDWSKSESQIPIVPRDEIKEFDLIIEYRVDTGETFGEGIFLGYTEDKNYSAIIELEIVDKPSWCSAVLGASTVATNLTRREVTSTELYLTIDEFAPAYSAEGVIKIKAKVKDLGWIKGDEKIFDLKFKPAYFPIISTSLPDINTKRIDAAENAVFPIEIENMGNARTKVVLNVEYVPAGWKATVTDEVFLGSEAGSKQTAYLTVIPPKDLGYHYGQGTVKISLTPERAENSEEKGNPIYANFIVQNRGFSSNGMENIYLVLIIIVIVIAAIVFIVKKRRK